MRVSTQSTGSDIKFNVEIGQNVNFIIFTIFIRIWSTRYIYPISLQAHDNHARETQALQGRIKHLQEMNSEANMDMIKQLQEENARLKTEANHAAQQ